MSVKIGDVLEGQLFGNNSCQLLRRSGEGTQSWVYEARPFPAMIYLNKALRGRSDPGTLVPGIPYTPGKPIKDPAQIKALSNAAQLVERAKLTAPTRGDTNALAKKSYGIVYRGDSVAVKILRPKYSSLKVMKQRFGREIWAVSELNHENVVRGIDFGSQILDGRIYYYLMLEYVKGVTNWNRQVPLDYRVAINVMRGLLRGLASAHEKNIVHRDMKPGNVLVDSRTLDKDDPDVRLGDFGLAALEHPEVLDTDELTRKQLTKTEDIIGTPAYFSPEHVLNPRLVCKGSDVYATASTLFFLITGTLPFTGSLLQVGRKITNREFPTQGRIPKNIWEGLEKGWRQDPDARPTAYEYADFWDEVAKKKLYEGAKSRKFTGTTRSVNMEATSKKIDKILNGGTQDSDVGKYCDHLAPFIPGLPEGSTQRIDALRRVVEG